MDSGDTSIGSSVWPERLRASCSQGMTNARARFCWQSFNWYANCLMSVARVASERPEKKNTCAYTLMQIVPHIVSLKRCGKSVAIENIKVSYKEESFRCKNQCTCRRFTLTSCLKTRTISSEEGLQGHIDRLLEMGEECMDHWRCEMQSEKS